MYQTLKSNIQRNEGGIEAFSRGYNRFGLHRVEGGVRAVEWAPMAKYLGLIGDFNGWDRGATPFTVDEYGVWTCFVPDRADGTPAIKHMDKIKLAMVTAKEEHVERLPAYARYCVQDPTSPCFPTYESVFWSPPNSYEWKHPKPEKPKTLRIYEAHVGMASEEGKVATYKEFTENILPRIAWLGYNAVQLMAVQEHPYYASFGYHVTSFFACSSRFGTPDDLKELVDTAHGLGLYVVMDIVHSHSAPNVLDGINNFDGTDHCYFHEGARGKHELWDSRLFNYGAWEVLRFLLSNVRWWLEEYRFDGYRFDGVTSVLFTHHGIGVGFSGGYHEYFGPNTDMDACVYLMMANDLAHSFPGTVTVAEDVSGMPTLCRPVAEGGFGFDYRLAMSIPDQWIKMVKEQRDEDWQMGHIVHTLTNRRHNEAVISYAESHDQALVGDKTLAFWLMDKEMYTGMSKLEPESPVVFRGMALHKMIRLLSFSLGGDAYLNFMGNEFGHPEWIDFPREGNNSSYHYARRQWSLSEKEHLRYRDLLNFDRAMMMLDENYQYLSHGHQYVSLKHEGDKMIVYERGQLVFVYNMHPSKSYENYRIGTNWPGTYRIVLDSDAPEFGGHNRHDKDTKFFSTEGLYLERPHSILVYSACRSVVVYAREEDIVGGSA